MLPDNPQSVELDNLPSMPFEQRANLPNIAAIYFVLTAEKTVLYIGRAQSLAQRWQSHNRSKQFATYPGVHIAWLAVSSAGLLPSIEEALITFFKPLCNGKSWEGQAQQTTVRLDPDILREAQYYLSLEGVSLARFVAQKVDEFLEEYRRAHPERIPGGHKGQHRPSKS